QFLSYPVIENGKKLGVLIFQVPVDKINAILTGNQKWKEHGMGDSGESFIVGKDKMMRSVSRFLVEHKSDYLAAMTSAGLSAENITYIDRQNTSALAVKIDSESVDSALKGTKGFEVA